MPAPIKTHTLQTIRQIAVSIGHNPNESGAQNRDYLEYNEAGVIGALLIGELRKRDVLGYSIGTGPLSKKIEMINKGWYDESTKSYRKFDAAIEVHLNAGGGTGSETLYQRGSVGGKSLSQCIEKSLATYRKSRGAKEGWYRMDGVTPLGFLAKTNCVSVISEPFFIDGDSALLGDLTVYRKLAELIADGICAWCTRP